MRRRTVTSTCCRLTCQCEYGYGNDFQHVFILLKYAYDLSLCKLVNTLMLEKFREIECITQLGIIDLVTMPKNVNSTGWVYVVVLLRCWLFLYM